MNYWALSIAVFIGMLTAALIQQHFSKKNKHINLSDLVVRDGELSTTKILQLVGGVTSTWIVVKLTLTTGINWDIFAIYLAYVASVEGFSKVISAKYSNGQNNGYRNNYSPATSYSPSNSDGPIGSAKTPEE